MDLLDLIYDVRDSLLSGKYNYSDPLTQQAFTTAFGAMRTAPQAFSALVDGLEAVKTIDPDDNEYARVREVELATEHAVLIAAFKGVVEAKSHRLRGTYAPGQSPIFTVPAELLANVFISLHDERSNRDSLSIFVIKTLRLVCRHFRDVIDNTAALWNPVIVTGAMDRDVTAIERTKNAPISMHIMPTLQEADWPQSIALAFAQFTRVTHLDFDLSRLSQLETPIEVVQRSNSLPSAPKLESLHIRGLSFNHTYLLMDGVFGGHIPSSLNDVAFNFCKLSNHTLLASSLSALALKNCSIRGTIDELMDSLSQLTHLRTFHWQNSTFDSDDKHDAWVSESHTTQSVSLPSLRSLTIRDTIPYIANLFSLLDLPGTVAISILIQDTTQGLTADQDPYSLVHAALNRHLTYNIPPDGAFRRISISTRDELYSVFSFIAESYTVENGPPSFEICIIRIGDDSQFHLRLLQRLVSRHVFHDAVNTLRVRRNLHSAAWLPFIRFCSQLETVELERSGAVSSFAGTLADFSGPAGAFRAIVVFGPEARNLVPRLRKIVLREEHLLSTDAFMFISGMDPDTGLGMLDHALRIRERAGLRIEQISVFGCSVSERAISQLRTNGHYKRLLWDGKLSGVNERQQRAYLKARESVFGSSFGSPRVLHEIQPFSYINH